MHSIADQIKQYEGENPFSDSQARNFSDEKIIGEFCPISNYWSLFNDQHEVLLGTRGSGKTFLLKMMRYSMLKRINDPRAKKLVSEKKYLCLYVPLYLEFVTQITESSIPEDEHVQLFQFAFNCLLAQSLLVETEALLAEVDNPCDRAQKNCNLAVEVNAMWFSDISESVSDLHSLTNKVMKLYYNFDMQKGNCLNSVPSVFKKPIGTPLLSAKEMVTRVLGYNNEPTWIICIDEAEFLTESLQKCINNVFRSDSKRIALKVATLPYYHKTLETTVPSISVSDGNDFRYRVVDMKHDDPDFLNLTNILCSSRIKSRFNNETNIERLEDFVGVAERFGEKERDDQIDYYRQEFGKDASTDEHIMQQIIENFSPTRKEGSRSYTNQEKTIHDKFAPIYFVRKMFAQSQKGHSVPGWYAGSAMIRKISQGNPRIFIQIMNDLFEKARKNRLTRKAQHRVLLRYAESFCDSTQALESYGPAIHDMLDKIAKFLQKKVHGQYLISVGCSFILKFEDDLSLQECKDWLQLAVAYSRLIVDEDTLKYGIRNDATFLLGNTYAAKYWLPMRADASPTIHWNDIRQDVSCPENTVLSLDQQPLLWKDTDDNI